LRHSENRWSSPFRRNMCRKGYWVSPRTYSFFTSGLKGNLCCLEAALWWRLSQVLPGPTLSFSGIVHPYSSSRSHKRSRCRLIHFALSACVGQFEFVSYLFLPSLYPSRAWKMLRLFIYWISPLWKSSLRQFSAAQNSRASRASAWASVIDGMVEGRRRLPYPVKSRRKYWISSLCSEFK